MKVRDKKLKANKYAKDRNYYQMLPMQELVNLVMGGERADELCLVLAERLEEMLEDQDNWTKWQAGHRYENNPED